MENGEKEGKEEGNEVGDNMPADSMDVEDCSVEEVVVKVNKEAKKKKVNKKEKGAERPKSAATGISSRLRSGRGAKVAPVVNVHTKPQHKKKGAVDQQEKTTGGDRSVDPMSDEPLWAKTLRDDVRILARSLKSTQGIQQDMNMQLLRLNDRQVDLLSQMYALRKDLRTCGLVEEETTTQQAERQEGEFEEKFVEVLEDIHAQT